MHIISIFTLALFPALLVADAISDFRHLQTRIANVSNQILSSVRIVNETMLVNGSAGIWNTSYHIANADRYPTAGAIQNISDSINASQSSYMRDLHAFTNGRSESDLNNAYINYVNEVLSLGQALNTRGRAWHGELNAPVGTAIRSLASSVNSYGLGLTQRKVLNDDSTIRTITASNSIVNAESTWAYSGNLPGSKRKRSVTIHPRAVWW